MSMNMRPLAPLPCFFRIALRIVHSENVPMARKLLSQEVANSSFESDSIRAGTRRHDHVHHVTALAAMQLIPPFLLHQVARSLVIGNRASLIVSNVVPLRDQVSQLGSAIFHAIAIACERESRGGLFRNGAGVETLLNDGGRLRVSRQPLALPAAQHNIALDLQRSVGSGFDRVSVASITKATAENVPHLLMRVRAAGNAHLDAKRADIAALGPVLEKVIPIATETRQLRPPSGNGVTP